ncbi:class I SAM-dependent methyltransferase [bacterium]|nr:class I SAM-dependent methyltransferase [bacterium]
MKRYGLFRFLWNYFIFRRKAVNKHGIHSPFVFNFVTEVIGQYRSIKHSDIENLRSRLKQRAEKIEVIDYGKGGEKKVKTVAHIAKNSLKPSALAKLIARTCEYFKIQNALELGTSLGITSAYIGRSIQGKLITLEGDPTILSIAEGVWNDLYLDNIEGLSGPFNETLKKALEAENFKLIFIDGHHQLEATLQYFEQILPFTSSDTIIIFDDIHWSPDMVKAWNKIIDREEVRCSIDLYFLGFVFFRQELSKQHFAVKL